MVFCYFNQHSFYNLTTGAHVKMVITLAISVALAACSNGDQEVLSNPVPKKTMPVSVIKVQPTTVPISAEAVAQTEGAKEVEIRPRVGGDFTQTLV